MNVDWSGIEDMQSRMEEYGRRCLRALHSVAEYWAPIIEAQAKQNAPWVDRTGNARQGLRGFAEDLNETSVAIFLTHSVDYGVYLELEYQGRYSIIMPTMEAHYQPIREMLNGIFK